VLNGFAFSDNQQVLYDVDFSIPPHTADAAPLIGAPFGVGEVVSGEPKVRAETSSYSDPCLEFAFDSDSGPVKSEVAFPVGVAADRYRIGFDLIAESLGAGRLVLQVDGGSLRNWVYFDSGGLIQRGSNTIGNFATGEVLSMSCDFLMEEDMIRLFRGGEVIYEGPLNNYGNDITSLRFIYLSSSTEGFRCALDNIRILSDPIPIGPPSLSSVAESIDFGDVFSGDRSTIEIDLRNTGGETLSLSQLTVAPPFSAQFSQASLQPQESAHLILNFEPTESVMASGMVTFSTNEPESPLYSIALSGVGLGVPQADIPSDPIELSLLAGAAGSSSLQFSNSGEGSFDWSLEFRNRGSIQPVEVSWLSTDSQAGTLAADESAVVTLDFDSTDLPAGLIELDLVVFTDAPGQAETIIPVALTVLPNPRLQVAPTELDFGNALVGESLELSLELRNVGTSDLVIDSIETSDAVFLTDFLEEITLAPEEAVSHSVYFAPSTQGDHSGSLIISSNDAVEPSRIIELSGRGTPPPEFSLSSSSLEFSAEFGTSPEHQTLQISNTGGIELTVDVEIQAAASSELLSLTPTFKGHSEYGLSKEDAEMIVQDESLAYQSSGISAKPVSTMEQPELVEILAHLSDTASITSLIPNRFDFSEGITGAYISDGGWDMFDFGNYLRINSQDYLSYSDRMVATDPDSMVEYFTLKADGLFVLAADVEDLEAFQISGGLGADGFGTVDGATIETRIGGSSFTGFLKRVHSAREPSVNQLIIFRSNGLAAQSFPTSTDSGDQTVTDLDGVERIYYLLFASQNGGYIENVEVQAIMEAFLTQIEEGSWLTLSADALAIAPDSSANLDVIATAENLESGYYAHELVFHTNDPLQQEVTVPVRLSVGAPPISFDSDSIHFAGITGLEVQSQSLQLNATAASNDGDAWSITKEAPWLSLSVDSGVLPATIELSVNPTDLSPGRYRDTLSISSNGAVQRIPVSFQLAALDPYALQASPYENAFYALASPVDPQSPSMLLKIDPETAEIVTVASNLIDARAMAFSPNGEVLYTYSGSQAKVARVSTATLEILSERNLAGLSYSQNYEDYLRMEVDIEERLLFTEAEYRPEVYLFDFGDANQLFPLRLHSGSYYVGGFGLDASR
jgi:hypothetical protein